MRTRTLVLLAAVCGVAILVAGVVQLLRIADTRDDVAEILVLGERTTLAGLSVRPVDVVADPAVEELVVTVELRFDDDGVTSQGDGVDAAAHFRLLAGELRRPVGGDDAACVSLTVAAQTCTLHFDTAGAPGGSRILVVDWQDESARWDLVAPPA